MRKKSSQDVIVERYNPIWPRQFELLSIQLKSILQDELLAIHHIGSTSIQGLDAKPIIDVIPVVKDITKVSIFTEKFRF